MFIAKVTWFQSKQAPRWPAPKYIDAKFPVTKTFASILNWWDSVFESNSNTVLDKGSILPIYCTDNIIGKITEINVTWRQTEMAPKRHKEILISH